VTPIAVIGSLQDGLASNFKTLAVKSAMDGLATMAFVTTFGWGAILSVIPVIAFQGTLALLARLAQPWLEKHALLDPINATAGLLVFCVALIILELKKIELADYLPASCSPAVGLVVALSRRYAVESALALILSPLRAGRGEHERTGFGSLFGGPDTVPPKVPTPFVKGSGSGWARLHGGSISNLNFAMPDRTLSGLTTP